MVTLKPAGLRLSPWPCCNWFWQLTACRQYYISSLKEVLESKDLSFILQVLNYLSLGKTDCYFRSWERPSEFSQERRYYENEGLVLEGRKQACCSIWKSLSWWLLSLCAVVVSMLHYGGSLHAEGLMESCHMALMGPQALPESQVWTVTEWTNAHRRALPCCVDSNSCGKMTWP